MRFRGRTDEEYRDEIVADVEFHSRVLEGLEPAFVGRVLFRVEAGWAPAPRRGESIRKPIPKPTTTKRRIGKYCSSIVGGAGGATPASLHGCTTSGRRMTAPSRVRQALRSFVRQRRQSLVPTGDSNSHDFRHCPQDSVSTNSTTWACQESEFRSQMTEKARRAIALRLSVLCPLFPDS